MSEEFLVFIEVLLRIERAIIYLTLAVLTAPPVTVMGT